MGKQRYFFVQTAGSKKFPRYRLFDCGKGYWTGSNWAMDESRACLYHDFQDAAADLRAIKILEHADKARRRFKATVSVDLIGNRPLDIVELAAHLADAARLNIHDHPSGEMLIFLEIDWGTLEELDETSPDTQPD